VFLPANYTIPSDFVYHQYVAFFCFAEAQSPATIKEAKIKQIPSKQSS
jgi:hypothetical protein